MVLNHSDLWTKKTAVVQSVLQHPSVFSCFPLTIPFHFYTLLQFFGATCFDLNGHLQAHIHVLYVIALWSLYNIHQCVSILSVKKVK
jgi:hypothetical protein